MTKRQGRFDNLECLISRHVGENRGFAAGSAGDAVCGVDVRRGCLVI